ncbi:hypothetical protein PHISCL_06381 [Aspergillus sclerotialis]|uniref:Uncharacterized protein n=1 Tax=Aspergillus sclerotialis TaxID=2070753 RepID=A0A3A2ZTI5_9EURO|nr:hypothetical protein PHISCL_06381 [Aspergillus sclerotialis]
MGCWNLVERVIGPKAEQNLGLLFRALRDSYQECKFGPYGKRYGPVIPFPVVYNVRSEMKLGKDPFESNAVGRQIQRSVFRHPGKRRWPKGKCWSRGKRRPKNLLQDCLLSRLPLDIQYMILDLLNHRNFARMWRAIDLPVSKHYWQSRAPRDIIHELQDIPKDDNYVDWEYLCLGLERLLERNPMLQSHRRAFELLQEPRDISHKLLKEERMK